MSREYYNMKTVQKKREERIKMGMSPTEKYSHMTTDEQISDVVREDSYAFGDRGKAFTHKLKDQVVKTGFMQMVVSDFKIKATDFDLTSEDMWDWVKEELSSKIKQILKTPKVGALINFGMRVKKTGADDRMAPNKFIMIKADGSPTGYYVNDWYSVRPTVNATIEELRLALRRTPSMRKGERELEFAVTVSKPTMEEGISLIPFELDRPKINREAAKIEKKEKKV